MKINGVRDAVVKRGRDGVYADYAVPTGGRAKKPKK